MDVFAKWSKELRMVVELKVRKILKIRLLKIYNCYVTILITNFI